jgi:RecB family exonuclease
VSLTSSRTVLRTDRAPRPEHLPEGARVLTPTRRAAQALGVPHLPLIAETRTELRAAGLAVAPPLRRWRALGEAVAEALPGRPVGPWRRSLVEPVRDLLRCGALDVDPPDGLSAGARRALAVAGAYRARLAEEGLLDPAERFVAATRHAPGRRQVPWAVLAGADLDGAALGYLDGVAAPGSLVVLPREAREAAEALVAAGWRTSEDPRGPERPGEHWARAFLDRSGPPADPPVALSFPSDDEEARWALARVGRLLADGVPPDDVLLIVRDPDAAAPRLEALAWELGVPVRVARSRTLAATPVGGVVAALAEAIGGDAPFEETLRLLRHRLVGGPSAETLARARGERPEGVAAWAELEPRAATLAWPRRDRRAAYGRRLVATLAALGLPRDDLDPDDGLAVRLALRGAAEAAAPPDEEVARRTFLDDVVEVAGVLRLPAPTLAGAAGPAVEAVGPTAAAGARVGHLLMLGANEGVLPADVRDDPVVDFADRAALRAAGADLAGAAAFARGEEAAFAQALRAAAGDAAICVTARAGGAPALPSPYLARLGATPVAPPARPPGSPEERRRHRLQGDGEDPADPVLAAARHAWRVEVAREGADPPGPYDGVPGRGRDPDAWVFSATSLTDLGQCPFRWYGRHLLGLREPEEVEEVVTPRLRGLLWHGSLERAVRRGVAAAGPQADEDRLRTAILEELAPAFAEAEAAEGVADTAAWRRVRGGELRALARLVRAGDFLAADRRPVEVERRFRGTWRGLPVVGTVDRVDAGPGGLELIDYKSGASRPKGALRASRRGWIDVQLPLYLEVAAPELAREHGLPEAPRRARYLSVRAAATLATVEPGDEDAELDELAQRVRSHLRAGRYPLAPDVRREVCRLCDLASVCRVGPRVERTRDAERRAAEGRAEEGAR